MNEKQYRKLYLCGFWYIIMNTMQIYYNPHDSNLKRLQLVGIISFTLFMIWAIGIINGSFETFHLSSNLIVDKILSIISLLSTIFLLNAMYSMTQHIH